MAGRRLRSPAPAATEAAALRGNLNTPRGLGRECVAGTNAGAAWRQPTDALASALPVGSPRSSRRRPGAGNRRVWIHALPTRIHYTATPSTRQRW